jgi:hypothetical protein
MFRYATCAEVMDLHRIEVWGGHAPLDKCQQTFEVLRGLYSRWPTDRPFHVAEIGVFAASFLVILGRIVAGVGTATGVDPYLSYDQACLPGVLKPRVAAINFEEVYGKAQQQLLNGAVTDCTTIVRASSQAPEVKHLFLNELGGLAALHIDGNHDYEFVSDDIRLAIEVVLPGGLVLMDDTPWPSVAAAVSAHLATHPDFALLHDFGVWQVWSRQNHVR